MARRTLVKDTRSHYCSGHGSEKNVWSDGSVFTTGYVESDYGIVAFNWWNGEGADRAPSPHDKRLHWLRLDYVVEGTCHSRTIDADRMTMIGVVRRARKFAQEKWAA